MDNWTRKQLKIVVESFKETVGPDDETWSGGYWACANDFERFIDGSLFGETELMKAVEAARDG